MESVQPDAAVLRLAANAIAQARACCGAVTAPLWCRVDLLPRASELDSVAPPPVKPGKRNNAKSHAHEEQALPLVGGDWMVSEFEALDPELYFKYGGDGAVARAAAAVANRYRKAMAMNRAEAFAD